ncbi:MAG: hypothetical protein Q4D53_07550 [Leptotrichiaceae bacterium]|nr:hypothetical protein [Leptotrichiaceae bacterium]
MDVKAVDLINKVHNLISRNDKKLLKEILVHVENKNMDLSIIKEKCKNTFFQKISFFYIIFLY